MDKVKRVERTIHEFEVAQDAIVPSGGVKLTDPLSPPKPDPEWHEFSPSEDGVAVGDPIAPLSIPQMDEAQWDDGVSWVAERNWTYPKLDLKAVSDRVQADREKAHDALLNIKPGQSMPVVDGMPAPVAKFQEARKKETARPEPTRTVHVEGTRAVVEGPRGVEQVFIPVDQTKIASPIVEGRVGPGSDDLWRVLDTPAPKVVSPPEVAPVPTYTDRLRKIWADIVSLVLDVIRG